MYRNLHTPNCTNQKLVWSNMKFSKTHPSKWRNYPMKQNIKTTWRVFVVIYVLLFANNSGEDGSSVHRRRRRWWWCVEVGCSDCVYCDGSFVCCDIIYSDVDSPITAARFVSIAFDPTVHMRRYFLCFITYCLLSYPPCKIEYYFLIC